MSGERHVILAVECDFRGYAPYNGRCAYEHAESLSDISSALDVVRESCAGKAVFLAHTSPFARRAHGDPFYTSRDYLDLWRRVQGAGSEVGLHPHEEEPDGSCYYYYYSVHMDRVLKEHVALLRSEGILATSQMMGYFGMNEWITPTAEQLGLTVSLNNVGRYVSFSHNNWNVAPLEPYYHSYEDSKSPGDSSVLEIPLGMTDLMRYEDGLVLHNRLGDLKRTWRRMAFEGRTRPCFLLLRASEMHRCRRTAATFLQFLDDDGAVFSTPTEVYRAMLPARDGGAPAAT